MFQSFINQVYFDNTIGSYLMVAGIILITLLLKRVISKYLAGLIARLIARKDKPFNIRRFQNLVLSPIEYFLLTLVTIIALETLNHPKVLDFKVHKTQFIDILSGASSVALIVALIWLCTRLLEYIAELLHERALLTQDRSDDQLIIFFKDFFKVIFVIIGFLLIIRFGFGKPIGNVLTGLSIVGAAVALAFKESMENLIASFVIFFDKPFTIGDLVKVQDVTGTVEKIGLRSSRIRTTEKTYVTVPNKQMVDTIVDNQSLRTQRHVSTRLEIGLSATAVQLQLLIQQIERVLLHEYIEDITVYLSEIGQASHVIQIDYFVSNEQSFNEFLQLRQQINLSILSLINNSGIKMAGAAADIVAAQKPQVQVV